MTLKNRNFKFGRVKYRHVHVQAPCQALGCVNLRKVGWVVVFSSTLQSIILLQRVLIYKIWLQSRQLLILREAELRSVETVCLLCGMVSLHLMSPLSQNWEYTYCITLLTCRLLHNIFRLSSVIIVFGEAFESARVKKNFKQVKVRHARTHADRYRWQSIRQASSINKQAFNFETLYCT